MSSGKRSVRFKVWKASWGKGQQSGTTYYAHMIAGNSRITWQTEGYKDEASAHKVIASTWKAINTAFAMAIPYTRDSLTPKGHVRC